MNRILTPAVRRWIYGISIATIALAVQQGWITPETAIVIAPLVLAILNVKPDDTEPDDADLTDLDFE